MQKAVIMPMDWAIFSEDKGGYTAFFFFPTWGVQVRNWTGLKFTAFPGKVKTVAERQKLEGGFSTIKVPFLTSINAKKPWFSGQKG